MNDIVRRYLLVDVFVDADVADVDRQQFCDLRIEEAAANGDLIDALKLFWIEKLNRGAFNLKMGDFLGFYFESLLKKSP